MAIFGLSTAWSVEPTPPATPQRLVEADAGRTIGLVVGGKLEVALEGNPTTGFRWEVGGGDTSVVTLSGEPEFKPSSGALGAGGKFTLRFEAAAAGQTVLKLIYHRPFERGAPPSRTFEVTVCVK